MREAQTDKHVLLASLRPRAPEGILGTQPTELQAMSRAGGLLFTVRTEDHPEPPTEDGKPLYKKVK